MYPYMGLKNSGQTNTNDPKCHDSDMPKSSILLVLRFFPLCVVVHWCHKLAQMAPQRVHYVCSQGRFNSAHSFARPGWICRTLLIPTFVCWTYQQVGFGCRETHQGVGATRLRVITELCWMRTFEAHPIHPTVCLKSTLALCLFSPDLRAPVHRPASQVNDPGLSQAKRTLSSSCPPIPDCLELQKAQNRH